MTDDLISRQAVLDELNKWDRQELYLPIHFKENIIDVVPSVNPQPCDDAISRDAVWDVMQELWGTSGELIDRLMALPSVNPQEPCSNCCNGNQIEKAKLCQKSYLAGMDHKQEPR